MEEKVKNKQGLFNEELKDLEIKLGFAKRSYLSGKEAHQVDCDISNGGSMPDGVYKNSAYNDIYYDMDSKYYKVYKYSDSELGLTPQEYEQLYMYRALVYIKDIKIKEEENRKYLKGIFHILIYFVIISVIAIIGSIVIFSNITSVLKYL